MDPLLPVSLGFVAVGAHFAALAVPLLRRRIKPNPWYGFRVPRTLDNPDRWYAVNAYAARFLLWGGIATAIAAPLLALWPGLGMDAYLLIMAAIVLAGPLLSLVLGLRLLRALP